MGEYLTILLGIILVNNYVLAQFLGICRSWEYPKSLIPL